MSGDDIVERLRRWDDGRISTHYEGCWDSHPVCAIVLAADAIEARDAEIERLRAEVADLHNGINWQTTCLHCAKLLDDNYDQYCQVERLRAEVEQLADELQQVASERALAESEEARRGC